jgi:hypothetical protein
MPTRTRDLFPVLSGTVRHHVQAQATRLHHPRLPVMALLEDEVAHLESASTYAVLYSASSSGSGNETAAIDLLLGTQARVEHAAAICAGCSLKLCAYVSPPQICVRVRVLVLVPVTGLATIRIRRRAGLLGQGWCAIPSLPLTAPREGVPG